MDTDPGQGVNINPSQVRLELDEILAREITGFLDVDSQTAMMSFNLATISCIIIIVEREREIKQYEDFPPERYILENFTSELVDIGLEKDAYLESAIGSSLKSGYISENDAGEFKAEMPAFMMAGFLDSMFPGMQGMNLIAFVLQINDEVNSGRKTLELAKKSFETTLKTRGVSVSKDRAEKKASEMASGEQKASPQSREVSTRLKKEKLNRLSQLMKTRKKRSADYQERVRVTDLFDKGPSKEEVEAQRREEAEAEEAARKAEKLARELAEKDEKIKDAQDAAKKAALQLKELEEKELQLKLAREEAQKAQDLAAQLAAKEAVMAEKEAQLKAMEEEIRIRQEQDRKEEELKADQEDQAEPDEEDIESRIAAFESELAMPCPLCKKGKVEEKTTEKGKLFFSCNDGDCRFVSWDKPYHFECPLCKNSFLTETITPKGEPGLKCPRAACTYSQENLLDPQQNMATAAQAAAPKRKRKLVRRKKRR